MNETVEIKLSNYLIDKAAARVTYQQNAVRKLRHNALSDAAQLAEQTLLMMERRLVRLLADHADLLREQGRAEDIRARGLRQRLVSWQRLRTAQDAFAPARVLKPEATL